MTMFYILCGVITYLLLGVITVILYSKWSGYNPMNQAEARPLGLVLVWPIIILGLALMYGIYWINHGISLLCCYFAKKELK